MKKLKIIILIIACIISQTLSATNNKIVFQISPARCLATAALRMWQARGDFLIMNEPMMYAYVQAHTSHSQFTDLITYSDYINTIWQLAENNNIFVKEESSVFIECLEQNPLILKDPRVHVIILVRNPHHAVISFYNRHKRIIPDFAYLLGYQQAYEIFKFAVDNAVNPPMLMFAEDLYNDPKSIAQSVCATLGIPFYEHMLHWESLGDNFDGQKWFDLKDQKTLYHWHADALKSTSIHQPTSYEVDLQGNPTFSEISNNADKEDCIKAYHFNKAFYDLIKSHLPKTQQ